MVVILDASQESLAVLDVAGWFAGTLVQRVEALFVEEEALTRAAGFPFAREISRIGGVPRALDRDAMDRDLKAAAGRARRAVAAAARRGSVPWQFDVVRGRHEHALAEHAAAGRLIALGSGGGAIAHRGIEWLARSASGRYLMVGPRAALRSGPVLVHGGGSPSAVGAGVLAERIAAALGRRAINVPDLGDMLAAAGVPGATGRARTAALESVISQPSLIVFAGDIQQASIRLDVMLEHALCPVLVTDALVPDAEADAAWT
jgi:hypothetical protein